MKSTYLRFGLMLLWLMPSILHAQNSRINTRQTIGWYNYFGTIKFNQYWGMHSEYQFRRDQLITDWQQSLLRLGINYSPNKDLLFRVGYGWIETFPYGDVSINALGKDFTEHRLFEMLQMQHAVGPVTLSHRYMLEQRWVGRYSDASLSKEDDYLLLHRARYMFRAQLPIFKAQRKKPSPYLAFYDELFIGFGENVNENVFDQNRIGALIGFPLYTSFRFEVGYLNQILQLGRELNGSNVYQFNNGVIVNANFTFEL